MDLLEAFINGTPNERWFIVLMVIGFIAFIRLMKG